MTRDEIIAKLLEHRAELEAAGAEHISLFGSVARGTATASSDIDVLVKLSEPVRQSGFGYFGALVDLKEMIENLTGRPVDVLPEPIQRERLRQNVERERVVAY
ncbi:nucleotidyltransferase domain-containing protein [Shinella yambaruensis]|uniref:Nucleotidyltransferase n=1 Tax=Shinella yambaruensis TaxID=415996 RepID=A0ABQ5ZT03_9HYPH|nr:MULTISPECIES: nucleotidyltransferase domain-containing protein [Shinella]CAI0336411.1 NTP_transf_2 domain-containing protein [Rhizobiaceae bacterium]CAK7254949.1 Polymerase nucleotidyl transferase domain-containing protein [Shinella sp. WSC3-e]MCJ8026422.1 nucleotidyltransferase domain-containing protein [Shinella yambaruensis]MCO5136556.1 nucleotidyltransferase domain-containing protein [Shinella sp.]MCU7981829.1 nucleotidyltransferase domain-containing protein [Shinella yambaruensis]